MEYQGRVKVTSGNAGVPDYYKKVLVCSLQQPRTGVDLVFFTKSHILELCGGLLVRSAALGEDIGEMSMRDTKNKQSEMFIVREEGGKWVYVLVAGTTAVIVAGEKLEEVRRFKNVEKVTVGDWLNAGQALIKIETAFGDPILTTGFVEIDLDQNWPSDPGVEKADDDNVKDALAERLEVTQGAVAAAKGMLEAEKALVVKTVRQLVHDCRLAYTVGEGELREMVKSKPEDRKEITVTGQWVRLVRESLVFGLEMETGDEDIGDINVCIVDLDLRYAIKVIEDDEDTPVERKAVKRNKKVHVTATFNLSSLGHFTNINIAGVIAYKLLASQKLLQSKTFCFKISSDDILNGKLGSKLNTHDNVFNRQSFLALICVGVRERLKVTTAHGCLNDLYERLSDCGMQMVPVIAGHSFTDSGHVLFGSCVILKQRNSREVEMEVVSSDYGKLALLVQAMCQVLPCDVELIMK